MPKPEWMSDDPRKVAWIEALLRERSYAERNGDTEGIKAINASLRDAGYRPPAQQATTNPQTTRAVPTTEKRG